MDEEIRLAKSTESLDTQCELMYSCNINVRRALAKNPHLKDTVASLLIFDPCLNVSYLVSENKCCSQSRDFSEEDLMHKCIKCDIDELELDCSKCNIIEN